MHKRTIRAKVHPNLLDRIDDYFGGTEGHRTNPEFLALAERIAGKVVTLGFVGRDAFEVEDDNYWLPECCWEQVNEETPCCD